MKHKKWINNIHLLREGELSKEEERALNTHLFQCKHCKAVYEQVQLEWIEVMGEMTGEPITRNPENLIDEILSAVNQQKHSMTAPPVVAHDTRKHFFFNPVLRFGLQLASLVLLTIFLVEQFQVAHSVQMLEAQMQSPEIHTQYSQVRIIPPMFRHKALVIVRNQLEKRGAPSKRIDRLIYDFEKRSGNNAVLRADRRDISRIERRVYDHLAKIKSMQADWRQP